MFPCHLLLKSLSAEWQAFFLLFQGVCVCQLEKSTQLIFSKTKSFVGKNDWSLVLGTEVGKMGPGKIDG